VEALRAGSTVAARIEIRNGGADLLVSDIASLQRVYEDSLAEQLRQ
jgi:hypothetical protein